MRDPYEILGVQKNATPAAIKSAFRRLAKKLHPDANKTDKTAATKFSELNAAYEILGDDDKRKAFDRGEIDAEGKPRFQGFGGGSGRGRGPWGAGGPGQDSNFESFTWGSDGFQRGGGGRAGGSRGRRRHRRYSQGDVRRRGRRRPARSSSRRISAAPRRAATSPAPSPSRCRRFLTGTSRRVHLPTGKEIDAKIPAGLADGQTIRLKGQGSPGPRRRCGRRADHGHDRRTSAVQARRRKPAARTAGDAL